jgi:hypothetical protein
LTIDQFGRCPKDVHPLTVVSAIDDGLCDLAGSFGVGRKRTLLKVRNNGYRDCGLGKDKNLTSQLKHQQ